MEEVKQILSALCGMTILRTSLSLLLPQGGLKTFAQFGFAAAQLAVVAQLFLHMTQILIGVFA